MRRKRSSWSSCLDWVSAFSCLPTKKFSMRLAWVNSLSSSAKSSHLNKCRPWSIESGTGPSRFNKNLKWSGVSASATEKMKARTTSRPKSKSDSLMESWSAPLLSTAKSTILWVFRKTMALRGDLWPHLIQLLILELQWDSCSNCSLSRSPMINLYNGLRKILTRCGL